EGRRERLAATSRGDEPAEVDGTHPGIEVTETPAASACSSRMIGPPCRKGVLVNKRMAGWGWLSLLWIGSVFAQQGSAEDPVLGKMGNVEIKASEIRRLIDAQPPELRKQMTGAAELDRLVRSELVRQSLLMEARSKSWDKKPDVALMMERARDQALLQMYVSNLARPPADYPTEDDIRRAYEANKGAFAVP